MSIDFVAKCLHDACVAPNALIQQESMKNLHDFECIEGFLVSLIAIVQQSNYVANERLLAVICIKNLVGRCWVDRGGNIRLLSPEEKSILRLFSCQHLDETDEKVALQLALVAGKIARHDWPNNWPNLFTLLYEGITKSQTLQKFRAMQLVRHVLQEITTKRFAGTSAETGRVVCNQLFPVIVTIWENSIEIINSDISNFSLLSDQHIISNIYPLSAHVLNCLRVLQLLLGFAFDFIIENNSNIGLFFNIFVNYLLSISIFLRYISNQSSMDMLEELWQDEADENEDEMDEEDCTLTIRNIEYHTSIKLSLLLILKKICRRMSMLPVWLQRSYPLSLAPYLSSFLSLYNSLLYAEYDINPTSPLTSQVAHIPQKHIQLKYPTIASILFISNVLSCRAYIDDPTNGDNKSNNYQISNKDSHKTNQRLELFWTAKNSISNFFDNECISKLMSLLLFRLLRLQSHDIEHWKEEPEEYAAAAQEELEGSHIRSASEGLFLGLLDRSPEVSLYWYICNLLRYSYVESFFVLIAIASPIDCLPIAGESVSRYLK